LSDLERDALDKGGSPEESRLLARKELGSEVEILTEVLSKEELKTWSQRYPKIMYLLTPALMYPLLFMALMMVIVFPLESLSSVQDATQPGQQSRTLGWIRAIVESILFFNSYLLAPLFTLFICFIAKRRTTLVLWPAAGIAIVAFVGAGWSYNLSWPTAAQEGSSSSEVFSPKQQARGCSLSHICKEQGVIGEIGGHNRHAKSRHDADQSDFSTAEGRISGCFSIDQRGRVLIVDI